MIDGPLTPVVRRARILERVKREGGASLAELASEHAVSPVTVHRDLEQLSGEGLIERVRGGARSLPDTRPPIEAGWNMRVRGAAREKSAIALKALSKDPKTAWRVTDTDWKHFELYDKFRKVSERALRRTSTRWNCARA